MEKAPNELKYRHIKSDLKKAFQYDLRKWDRVNECLDRKKYRCVHLYLKQFNYSLQNICNTSVRANLPFPVSEIVERTYTSDQKFAYHEVEYQILCAELYFVVSSFEMHNDIYSNPWPSDSPKIRQKCWSVTKELFDSYHEDMGKFKDIPESKIIASTMMSAPFNLAVVKVFDYLKQRTDIDTRNLEQKVVDAAKSGVDSILTVIFELVFVITVAIAIMLMAKCCGADVHPFG